jgi:signal transduction histidine kinase
MPIQAREAERRRIAREMHDVLAHRLCCAASRRRRSSFGRTFRRRRSSEAAAVIRTTAITALEELREVIGVMSDQAAAMNGVPVGVSRRRMRC